MEFTEFRFDVPEEFDGKPVKAFLKSLGVSRRVTNLAKHAENGITLDGAHLRTVDPLRAGSVLTLRVPRDERPAVSTGTAVPVLYEDEHIVAFDKPAGMTVHPVRDYKSGTLADAFATHMAAAGRQAAFRPVGRLDRNTSGIVLAAKHPPAATLLSGAVFKTYCLICRGDLAEGGTVDAPLHRKEGHGIRREAGGFGEPAVTRYLPVGRNGRFTVCLVTTETGRTHQIRAHFEYLGRVLLGDDMYGDTEGLFPRHALHCMQVEFTKPFSDERIRLFSPIPVDMRAFAEARGLTLPKL